MGLLRWIRKSVVTDDYRLVNRIGHGDGGPNDIEYHYDIAEIINKLAENNLISSPAIQTYPADDNCIVTADGPGVTATRITGQITITIPSTVNILSFRIHGDSSELSSGQLTVIISGGRASGTIYNLNDATARYPKIDYGTRTQVLISDPFTQLPHDASAGSFVVEHTPISNDQPGRTITTIKQISGDWEIYGQL